MRRVVVTGLGIVCPLGIGIDHVWNRLINNASGITNLRGFDTEGLPSLVAGHIPVDPNDNGAFICEDWVTQQQKRRMDKFIIYAIAAARMAIQDASWSTNDEHTALRSGVLVGSGIGGLTSIEEAVITIHEKGVKRLTPYFIPSSLINLASGHISIEHNLKGPNHSIVTACATGTHAISDAANMIAQDKVDMMVTGGTEAPICRLGMVGFSAMKALSTHFNDQPRRASRPWDQNRDGFVMGEGAGILILESLEHAKKRNANIYGEISGYGMSGDSYHITAPASDGNGGFRAMQTALEHAKINFDEIDYINAHGTSTPLGDEIEINAIKDLFKEHAKQLAVSSTKSAIGHLLGAAGAVEAIFCLKALQTGIIPPTLNLENPSPGCDLNLVPHHAQERKLTHVLSNSFGFGGTNGSIIFSKI